MLNKAFFILLLLSSFAYCKINLALSSNMTYAISDIINAFNKKYPDIKISLNIGSSGSLFAQIKNNAPYDIYMAANMYYPDKLYESGVTLHKPTIYAKGELSFFSNKKLDLKKGLKSLEDKYISKIAIANPKTAPYGKATLQALKNAKVYENIKTKLLYAQNISQVVNYIVNGVDIGIVAKSSLYSSRLDKYKKNSFPLDIKLYKPINQGIVILKNSKNIKKAKAFYDFILSSKAKEILKQYGYLVNE